MSLRLDEDEKGTPPLWVWIVMICGLIGLLVLGSVILAALWGLLLFLTVGKVA